METTASLEKLRAKSLADRYRRKGYEVMEEPSPDQMPDFLAGYRPAMILRKGGESIIVEVKARESLIGYPKLGDLTDLLRSKPGWRLDLALVATGDRIDIHRDSEPLNREDILQTLEESERLLDKGFVEAALLRGWAGAEATSRLIAEEEGLSPEKAPSMYVLQLAAMEGPMNRDDYKVLARILRCRNALAHGFTPPPDFDVALVEELIETTRRVLSMELEPRSAYAD